MHIVHLQMGDTMVVVQSDEEELDTCVHAAHNEMLWLKTKERVEAFADHR
jgi:hypothetical protein